MSEQKTKFKFISLTDSQKKMYLDFLGYHIDEEGFIIDSDEGRIKCPYTDQFVDFENASILPGSTVIVNTSAYTLSSYISDYLEGDDADDDGL